MKKFIIILSIIMVVVSNLPFIDVEIALRYDDEYYRYSNQDGSFTFQQNLEPKGGYLYPEMINAFIEETKPLPENQVIYRVYKINPLCFWRWSLYLRPMTRDYEYKSWKEIEQRRKTISENPLKLSKWQDF